MESKTSDDVSVIRASFEKGKVRTHIQDREWVFPRLMKIMEFQEYFLLNNYPVDILVREKRIVAVVFPGNLIQESLI